MNFKADEKKKQKGRLCFDEGEERDSKGRRERGLSGRTRRMGGEKAQTDGSDLLSVNKKAQNHVFNRSCLRNTETRQR
jgi:hypothetical protein